MTTPERREEPQMGTTSKGRRVQRVGVQRVHIWDKFHKLFFTKTGPWV